MTTLEKPIRLEPIIDRQLKSQSRYVTTELIGKGGMGSVFRGIDNTLNREVAIKKLPKEKSLNSKLKGNTLPHEAKILATLNHPNIVTVYDINQDEDEIYIVMELLSGSTLQEVSKYGQFEMTQLADLVTQTQDALLAANIAGLIHGDLKPQNIMRSQRHNNSYQYKLLDFDQARIIGHGSDSITNNDTSGSIYFMAPERFEGTAPSHTSDIYAMGCIYYYMLTGQHPCQGETTIEVMASHLRGDITPLETLRPDLPKWVSQWISWLMTRDPNSRPQSPLAVAQSFQELMKRYSSVPEQMINFPQQEKWYVSRDGQVGGPHTWESLQSYYQNGHLVGQDMVKSASMEKWAQLETVSNPTYQNAG